MVEDLFLNEDLSKPENRINVALFGLMTLDWFREWFLVALDLPVDARVYPQSNENGVRPDLKVVDPTDVTLARIEVELGSNPAQVADYESRFEEPIRTVFGRKSHGGDLSLEEIANCLDSEADLPPQAEVNVKHLRDQIRQSLSEFSSSSSTRAEVSGEMKDHPLVSGLNERLGDRLVFTTGSIPVGCLGADTNKPQGFSLRVNSRESSSGTLSVLFISGGRDSVNFPSEAKLEKYLPRHGVAIHEYVRLLDELGLSLGDYALNARPSLPLSEVVDALDGIANCVGALAARPSRHATRDNP